ncbi:MAG: GIY-YIG nuclease family protein [Nitritalea sp.]
MKYKNFFVKLYFLHLTFTSYVLYSQKFDKVYVGFTSNQEQRLLSHNHLGKKGWTIKYRPWTVFHTETCKTKSKFKANSTNIYFAAGK